MGVFSTIICHYVIEYVCVLLTVLQEALKTAEEMKKRGNQSFKDGDYYDSLWKYEHANTLLDSFECLKVNEEVAVLHSNISASCMKLGDEGRLELLHSVEGFPIHQIMWYGFSHQHAQSAIVLQPKPKIACKVSGFTSTVDPH